MSYFNEWLTAWSLDTKPDLYDAWNARQAEIDALEEKLRIAVDALAEIREIYAGSELGIPVYAQEAYAIEQCKKQYQEACDALAKIKEN